MRPLGKLLLVAAVLALAGAAGAQDASIGQIEYMNSCAQCHGPAGKGDGPMVSFLSGSMPDITGIQAANGGVFPVASVYAVIDGSEAGGAHGSREMPAWGQRYMAGAPKELGFFDAPGDAEALTRGRILALIEYISTLQAQ